MGVYRPPSAISSATNNLADLLAQYCNSEMLVLGDFNLDCLTSDSNGLQEICVNLNPAQLIDEQTYFEGSLNVNIDRSCSV